MRMVNPAAMVLVALSLLVAAARSDERGLSASPAQPATRPERAPIARLRDVDLGDFWRGEKPAFGEGYNMLQRQAGYLGSAELGVSVRDKCVRRAGVIVFHSKPEALAAVEFWRHNVANIIEPGTPTDQRRNPWWFCAKSAQPLLIVVYDGLVVWASDIYFGTRYEKVEGELWKAVEKIHSSVAADGPPEQAVASVAASAGGPGSRPSPERMKELIEALAGGHGDKAARKAVKELRLSGSAAVPYLTEAVRDDRRNVRWLAVETLGAIGGIETAPALIEAMGDPDKDVRRYAATFLGQVGGGDAPCLAALRKGLKDEDTEVVLHILWALDRLGDEAFRQDEALLGRLLAQLTQGQTAWAAQCLGIVRNEKAVEPLVQALRVKPMAAQGIGRALAEIHSHKAVPGLVAILKEKGLDSRSVWEAGTALQALADPSANEELLALTASSSPWASLAAVRALGFAGNKAAVARLSQLAADVTQDTVRREEALRALGRTEEPSAVPALGKAVADPEERLANEAVEALGWVKCPEAAAVLRSRLKAESCVHVIYAVTSLGRIGDLSDARAILEVFDRKDALDSTHFANPRMANVATACHFALTDITKTQVTSKDKLFFVVSTPQRLQEVREAWRQKLAQLNAASRPADGAAAENDLSVELVFRKNPPAFAAGESIVVEARFVNRTDKPQVYRGGLGDKNIKFSCQIALTGEGGKAWSTRAAAAPMANYKDIIVPAGGQASIGEWDLSTLAYSEGSLWSAGGKIPFADVARPGRYRLRWWDGVFQAGTPLRSKPVDFEIVQKAAPAATQPETHGYMGRVRPLLPKGWSVRALTEDALCIEHEQSPTRIMLRIGTRIGGHEEYRRLMAQRQEFLEQWHARFPHGTSMMPNAPAVLLNPPTHFDDRHSVWLQSFRTGPGAQAGKIESKEIAAERNSVYQSVAKLFTPYDSSPPGK